MGKIIKVIFTLILGAMIIGGIFFCNYIGKELSEARHGYGTTIMF